jgi:hypothetical protein
MSADLDPRWNWTELCRFGSTQPIYIKGRCNHLDVVPVETAGEVVAHLCVTCDVQLPAEWSDD